MSLSIRENYFYNTFLKVVNLFFPLILFPYLSRVLGPDGLGKISFSLSYMEYFILFSSLGIMIYGVREIAQVRDDRSKLSKIFSEILLIKIIFTVIVLAIFFISIDLSSKLKDYIDIFKLLSFNIIFSIFSLDWFFQGVENFKYISIRSVIIKMISLVMIFLFVKSPDDLMKYFYIIVSMFVIGNLLNFISVFFYSSLTFKGLDIKRHIKSIIILFGVQGAIGIYVNLDKVMLGFLTGDKQVAFYTIAVKISRIIMAMIASLGVIMIPRISHYLKKKEFDKYKELSKKSMNFVLMMALPCVAGLFVISRDIVLLFSGPEFEPSYITLRIVSPIILSIGLSNFFGMQILFTHKQEKKLFFTVLSGALMNFILNLLLIPGFGFNGAAVATLFTEFTVMLSQFYFSRKYIDFQLREIRFFKYLSFTVIMLFAIYILRNLITGRYLMIGSIITGVLTYLCCLILSKDEFYLLLKNTIYRGKDV